MTALAEQALDFSLKPPAKRARTESGSSHGSTSPQHPSSTSSPHHTVPTALNFGTPVSPLFRPFDITGGSAFSHPALCSLPDPSLFPSLALATLQRRRKTPQSPSKSAKSSPVKSPEKPEEHSDAQKDEAYWERRRKNNEAAKRSRDMRRQKEDEIAVRAAFLEQENLKLRAQVAVLKNETAKLQFLLFNNAAQRQIEAKTAVH